MGVSPSLKLIRKVKNLIEMMLTISSRTRTEHKCAALEESHRHSRCPLLEQPPQQLVGNRQAQSTWALGEDPVGQIFSRCGRMCIDRACVDSCLDNQRKGSSRAVVSWAFKMKRIQSAYRRAATSAIWRHFPVKYGQLGKMLPL